jgi:hypothetical protein
MPILAKSMNIRSNLISAGMTAKPEPIQIARIEHAACSAILTDQHYPTRKI